MAKYLRGGFAGAALMLAAGCVTPNSAFDGDYVTDYSSCVAKGHPVDIEHPDHCYFDGQVFVRGR